MVYLEITTLETIPYQSVYKLGSKQNYVFGGVYTQGAAVTTYVDPTLKWERTKTTDFALKRDSSRIH